MSEGAAGPSTGKRRGLWGPLRVQNAGQGGIGKGSTEKEPENSQSSEGKTLKKEKSSLPHVSNRSLWQASDSVCYWGLPRAKSISQHLRLPVVNDRLSPCRINVFKREMLGREPRNHVMCTRNPAPCAHSASSPPCSDTPSSETHS